LIAIDVSIYSTGNLLESQDSSTDSGSNNSDSNDGSEIESEFDIPAQKKRKIDNPKAQTVRDDLLAVNGPILEGADRTRP
jgi:hypothetical protein